MRAFVFHILCAYILIALLVRPAAADVALGDIPPQAVAPDLLAESLAGGAAAATSSEGLPLGRSRGESPGFTGSASSTTSGSWLLDTLMALGVVVGLIFGVRLLLQRTAGRGGAGRGAGLVEVLARTTIAPKTQLMFLRIHQRVVVAAHSPSGMDTLAVLDDPEDVAWVLREVQAARPGSVTRSFRQALGRMDRQYEAMDAPSSAAEGDLPVGPARQGVAGLLGRIQLMKKLGDGSRGRNDA